MSKWGQISRPETVLGYPMNYNDLASKLEDYVEKLDPKAQAALKKGCDFDGFLDQINHVIRKGHSGSIGVNWGVMEQAIEYCVKEALAEEGIFI